MVRLEDRAILERDAHDEFNNPLPQKICDDRTIYLSRNNYGQPNSITGIVSSTDFGLSVKGVGPHHGCIQAEPYRAPEVILDAGWTYSSDIWNLGVMVCFRASPSRERL
jgi:serine/threonine protein kinase